MPALLLRRNPRCHKNNFGHVLVLAGSKRMLGAAALVSQAAMRAGAGLVTLGIPESLNLAAHKKISSVIMTLPLSETKEKSLSSKAYPAIKEELSRYQAIAIGPGLSQDQSTRKLVLKIISTVNKPLIIDADALSAVAEDPSVLCATQSIKILTPHPGEMSRLIKRSVHFVENNREKVAKDFAKKYHCFIVLKGHTTIVAAPKGKVYLNKTGNVGMATAGSGDVLTGITSAFLAQKIDSFEAAKTAVFIHGKAGDIAASKKGKVSLLATDIIENLSSAFQNCQENDFHDIKS
ncbi:MAG: NAD(P)H-hydrate dehydratase [Candidatus Omnitrophota bacterium]